jgi:hypothetical protein
MLPVGISTGVNVSTKKKPFLTFNIIFMDQKIEALSHFASRSNVIRITVPANVANDLTLLTTLLKDLGDRIGCKPCISGAACFFDNERDFVVNPQGKIANIQTH